MRVVELFAGVGSQHQALKNIGADFEVVAISEIDKFAIKSYEMLHGPVRNLGDISNLSPIDVPDCDLITYSFPCQDISLAGKQRGLDKDSGTRSSLLWYCEDIIREKKPKYLLMENVKNLCGPTHMKNFKAWQEVLEEMGYKNYWAVLDAQNYGVPQHRERVFMVSILGDDGFSFPSSLDGCGTISDILDREENPALIMSQELVPTTTTAKSSLHCVGLLNMKGLESNRRVYAVDGVCPTLTTMTGGNRQPKVLVNGHVRKLSPRECWKLMGWTDTQFDKIKGISNTQLYKQAGNSIVVPVLEEIFKKILGNNK